MKLRARFVRYGWKLDGSGKLVQDTREQRIIVQIATRHARGESNAEIAQALRRERVLGPGREHGGDGRWWPQTVKAIIGANSAAVQDASVRIAYEPFAQQAALAKSEEALRAQREELQRIADGEGANRFTFEQGVRTGLGQGFGISPVVQELTAEARDRVHSFIKELRLPPKTAGHLRRAANVLLNELMLLRQRNVYLRQQLSDLKAAPQLRQENDKSRSSSSIAPPALSRQLTLSRGIGQPTLLNGDKESTTET